jgi:phosphocarrier protein HPr
MSQAPQSMTVTINNPQGLHMRPAYLFAETASKFDSKIELIKDDIRIDGKSVLSILTLGAAQGTQISVEATGSDALDALNVLGKLLSSGFPATADSSESNSG